MKALSKEDLLFCKTFVKTLDFHASCNSSKVNRASMLVRVIDEEDNINLYIRNAIDEKQVSNKFVTKELITSELINILMSDDNKDKLSSAKMLLSLTNGKDKTKEFVNLINAINKGA